MDTLAAAYARAGNFKEAIHWQERALENPQLSPEVQNRMRARLQLYRDGKAYQEE